MKSLTFGVILLVTAPLTTFAQNETKRLQLNELGQAGESEQQGAYAWMGEFGRNARVAFDFSTRYIRNETADMNAYANFLGIDFHKVVSNGFQDIGTLTLQPYLTRIDNMGAHPPFFEGPNDWELVYRIFNFNYTALSQGQFNIRIGHMEVPFGLEHIVNTNGTLRDYMHGPNIGVKADWGVSANGTLEQFEYEVAILRGTGNEYSDTGDPYIFAGRIGTHRENPLSFGLSAYKGHIQRLGLPDKTLARERIGLDVIYHFSVCSFLAELSIGDDEGTDIVNSIYELDWQNRDETVTAFWQIQDTRRKTGGNWDHATNSFLGLRYAPDSHWAMSVMWKRGLEALGAAKRDNIFFAQLRYRL